MYILGNNLVFLTEVLMINLGTSVGSTLTNAASSISDSVKEVRKASQHVASSTIVRPVEGTGEITKPMLNMKESANLVAANGKVIKAADEQLGSLLDTQA